MEKAKMKVLLNIGFILILTLCLQTCGKEIKQTEKKKKDANVLDTIKQQETFEIINPDGTTIQTRILPPPGFQRTKQHDSSFAAYLRQLPLKPHGSEVILYNGEVKPNYDVYVAVVDLPIGNKDLHQCADAVMRLRAEYLWKRKLYDKIHFNFTNGFRVDYSEWMKGKRMVVKGNTTYWTQSAAPSNTYNDFWKYMELIFNYAGTLSLSKELKPVEINKMEIGDVFIHRSLAGHAIIVVDIVEDIATGKKLFLLAQSYMPAQETQILQNPNDTKISPWYSIDFGERLNTPEWSFEATDLKRFEE